MKKEPEIRPKRQFVPQLSIEGNHDEYHIPRTPLGDAVCALPLTWASVEGRIQPAIVMKGVGYPSFTRLTRNEAIQRAGAQTEPEQKEACHV